METVHRRAPGTLKGPQAWWRELLTDMLPAALSGEFTRFSEGLFRFGCTAGGCFSAPQHQVFASERTARLVEHVRSMGVHGVGQSSWGPTLFALLPEPAAAETFVHALRSSTQTADSELHIAPITQSGAQVL